MGDDSIMSLKISKEQKKYQDFHKNIDSSPNEEENVYETFEMTEIECEQKRNLNINIDLVNSTKKSPWNLHDWCNHKILYTISEIVTGIIFLSILEEIMHSLKCQTGNYNIWILAYHILFYMTSSICSQIIAYIGDLPSFIGMVLAGMVTGSLSMKIYKKYETECMNYYYFIIRVTLFIMMIICGLKLNVYKLQRICNILVKLILFLLVIQLIVYNIYSSFWASYLEFNKIFYYKMDLWIISSAILVPNVLRLKRMGYSKESNIFNLLLSEASILQAVHFILVEFILIIISLRNTDKENYRAYFYIKNLCVTLVISIVWGTLLMSVQSWQWTKTKSKKASNLMIDHILITTIRVILLCVIIFPYELIFKSDYLLSELNQSLVCFISSSIAATGWIRSSGKKHIINNQRTSIITDDHNEIESSINAIVNIFEYILDIFQTFYCMGIGHVIGIYIKYLNFTNISVLLSILLVLAISATIHIIVITCSVWKSEFNRNEKIFINMAYIYDIPLQTTLSFAIFNFIEDNEMLIITSVDKYINIFSKNQLIILILSIFIIMSYGTRFLSKNVSGN